MWKESKVNTKRTALKAIHVFIAVGVLAFNVASWNPSATGKVYALTGIAAIGGGIFTGSQLPDGSPNTTSAAPLMGASVMVQNMHSGGAFVTYGTVTGNTWTADVPAPGEYVVMFSAPGHDNTSREFTVEEGNTQSKDAYLPPLPLPAANLLVYAFQDDYVNGEDDYPDDPALAGVTFNVYDEEGDLLATGVSGSQPPSNLPPGAGPHPDGLYYFTGLPPGEVVVCADPPTPDWYLTTTEEGGHCWDPKLYPGDPGTEGGGYLVWFGFVPKLGQIGDPSNPTPYNPAIVGSIGGTLLDADGNDPAEPFPAIPNVTPNGPVPDGLAILFTDFESVPVHPVATVEADPVTGAYTFANVPPGRYKIFAVDVPLDYVWVQQQVTVLPNFHSAVSPLVPRFFARAQGYVIDSSTGLPIAGATVNLRYKDGSIKKQAIANADGWYNFDNLPEIEVMGYVDVEPPVGYHGLLELNPDTGKLFNMATRYVQWFTFNYRADLRVEPVPMTDGDIAGFVYYDHLETGTWVGDGIYQDEEERTMHGVTVELYEVSDTLGGMALIATTTTGNFNTADTLAQGWTEPYTWPPDEFGGVYSGPLPGFYEFRGLAPGDYMIKVIPPTGYFPSPAGSDLVPVTVTGGAQADQNFGINTLVPLAGEIEGGVFDDLNIDANPLSLLFLEKAGIPGAPVGVYDHLGYLLGVGHMGNPLCYAGSTVCPPGEPPVQKPEMERRFAPGVHIYLGNDPSQPGFNPNYEPMALNYEFGQGKYKFEADWSLIPVAFMGLGRAMLGNGPIVPDNAPVVDAVLPVGSFLITGHNFGTVQGYSTVTLSGQPLKVTSWSDTAIHVETSPKLVGGPLLVATSTGISNAVYAIVPDTTPQWVKYFVKRSVFVDAGNTGPEDGSPTRPWNTIGEALNHLPSATPRYVFVAAGTYRERVQIPMSNVYLIGAGPLETTVDGHAAGDKGPVFFIGAGGETGGVRNIMISGFTITGGSVEDEIGAGIFGDYGNRDIDINNSIITRNGGYYGGGVWLHKSNHNVKVWSNIIAENGNSGGYGGGISVNDEPEYGPEHTEPEHIADDHNPGPPPGTYRIFNNLIFHNFSPDYGGGLTLYEIKDRLLIYGNVILENKADDHGGGIFFEDTGPIEVYGNVFLRNYSADDGGAISFEDVGDDTAIVKVYNNLFAENIADDRGENHARGGALAFDDTFYASVYNNTIVGNIVAGSYDPAGGGLDSERNGHEYNGVSGPYKAPGFSDPKIYNNILWGNWRLNYDQPASAGGEDLPYTWGVNYRWSADEMHVDNPAVQPEWQGTNNSESFTYVKYNDIRGGYLAGLRNLDIDPLFADPFSLDWHLQAGSPVINKAPTQGGPTTDLELRLRNRKDGKIDLGAYEWFTSLAGGVRIPVGILGVLEIPRP